MKKQFFCALVATLALCAAAKTAKENPTLLSVAGKDVKLSEFEYYFDKNNTQQAEPQSLDQYLQMFVTYKQKVADAEASGIQNTPEFEKEYAKFCDDLIMPYLRDASVEDSLVQLSYNRRKESVLVSHIMFRPDDSARADSVRNAIVSGTLRFEDAAGQFSLDRGSNKRGGLMGVVVPDRYPYPFEDAAYRTPEGEITPVVNSGVGLHIIRVEKRGPAEGEVNAAHILLDTRRASSEEKDRAKVLIDSIYEAAAGGADFAELARKYSKDPGSANRGGDLGWFGRGVMVAEFDSIAFALADGEVSRPFSTMFGYHIIKRNGHRGVPELDDKLREKILAAMSRDSRGNAPYKARMSQLRTKYNAGVNSRAMDEVKAIITSNGGYTPAAVEALHSLDMPVASCDGVDISSGEVFASLPDQIGAESDVENAMSFINQHIDKAIDAAVTDCYRKELASTNPDYANLVNEYRDGILLFDISNRNVWNRASQDTVGLEKHFVEHRDKYRWEQPKFKSYIIFARNDSVLNNAVLYADSLDSSNPSEFAREMHKHFGSVVKVERVVAAKGENAYTDYLGFGGPRPSTDSKNVWKVFEAYKGSVSEQPEEAADVRGAVLADYQAQLEKDWVASLQKKYKVKVNKKVFNKLKQERGQ